MSDTLRYPSVPPKTLANDLSSTGTLIQLTECNDWGGTALTAANFNTTYIPGTLINDARTLAEFVLIDASTIANATTTGLLLYKRGLKYYAEGNATDLDEVTANKLPWTQGETKLLIGTNPPYMYAQFPAKGNDETITGLWQFPSNGDTPVIGSTYVAPTLDNQVATKKYADDLAIAGSPDATTGVKGIVEIATGAELAAGTGTGSTGATVVAAGSSFKNTSAGAGDANKVPVLDAAGVLDNTFMPTILTRTADSLQISTAPDSDDDAVNKAYVDGVLVGSGADGALNVTSGTTTLTTDKVYNYTTFNVSLGATLTTGGSMANKPLRIKVQGDCTIAGTINLEGKGALGGVSAGKAAGTVGAVGIGLVAYGYGGGGGSGDWESGPTNGNNGNNATSTAPGTGGASVGSGNGYAGADGGAGTYVGSGITTILIAYESGIIAAGCGSGGGGGGAGAIAGNYYAVGAAGGNGGGCLILEVGGNLTITGTVNVSGANGSNGGTEAHNCSAGGGGGGGGGTFVALYRGTLTDSGTYDVTGGTGGTGNTAGSADAGNGGNGSAGAYALIAV